MNPARKSCILVPVDFDEASRRAVEHAIALAKALGLPVRILHVVPPTSFPEGTRLLPVDAEEPVDLTEYVSARARHLLDETFIDLLVEGVEVAREARSGHAPEAILRAIDEQRAMLVVMGTHARTGLERAVVGSVAEEIIRRSPVPVLVVRNLDQAEADELPRKGKHALAGATTISGAVAGAAVGSLAGPPGAIAGGAIGTILGAVAGRTVENELTRAGAHDRQLDAEIGVTGGSLGVPAEAKRPSREVLEDAAEVR